MNPAYNKVKPITACKACIKIPMQPRTRESGRLAHDNRAFSAPHFLEIARATQN